MGNTSNGYWWSRTAYDSTIAYNLNINSSNVNPGTNTNNRYNGLAVRCVASSDPSKKYMSIEVFQHRQTREIIRYVREEYGDELEFLWQKFPRDAIWRNPQTRKWYGLIMEVSLDKLGIDSDKKAEILVLRFQKGEALDFVASNDGIYPGYHMNKNSWITVILDGRMEMAQIVALLDNSYRLTA